MTKKRGATREMYILRKTRDASGTCVALFPAGVIPVFVNNGAARARTHARTADYACDR